jgi:hypothetical protein
VLRLDYFDNGMVRVPLAHGDTAAGLVKRLDENIEVAHNGY